MYVHCLRALRHMHDEYVCDMLHVDDSLMHAHVFNRCRFLMFFGFGRTYYLMLCFETCSALFYGARFWSKM